MIAGLATTVAGAAGLWVTVLAEGTAVSVWPVAPSILVPGRRWASVGPRVRKKVPVVPPTHRRVAAVVWKPAVDQLRAANYDFGRLKAILLTHAHWDHMNG